jgi:alginate O-acetyltransferase complex protein AlgI
LTVFAVYWLLPRHRWRMLWLLAASFYFYMSWNPWLILLILFSASVDYCVALYLERVSTPRLRKLLVILSISTNLGLLAYFKYTNFFLATVHATAEKVGLHYSYTALDIVLPLGVSFYTFETICYIVDVYRGKIRAVRSLLDYALYIMFFPHLIAGPIVRPRDFLPQIHRPKRFDWDRLQLGLQLFLLGLFKKAVIADHVAAVVYPVFKDPVPYGSFATWLAVLGYAVQIYCDFSGYSDMAIGTAHLFGFRLKRNFNMPYLACNIADFWHRWHISLSTWLRDYLYVPLGGSRHGRWATYRNLLITMLLGGLWHGANWTFIAWGLYHGLLLAINRAFTLPRWLTGAWFRPVAILSTLLAVCVGWVFFRAQSFEQAGVVLHRMFWPVAGQQLTRLEVATAVLCITAVVLGHLLGGLFDVPRLLRRVPGVALGISMGCFLVVILALFPETYSAFIYFQF